MLYVAYNTMRSGHCVVMLATSQDGGQSWSRARELAPGRETTVAKYFPILAVNGSGVLGLLWRGRTDLSPGCWFFSTSRDRIKIDATVQLSACNKQDSIQQQLSDDLATLIEQSKPGHPTLIQVLTLRDYLTRVAMTATEDDMFHPVWSAMTNGRSELRTARIDVSRCGLHVGGSHQPGLIDVTGSIAILYGGAQRIDHETKEVVIDLSFQNRSKVAMHGPLFLRFESLDSNFGEVEVRGHSRSAVSRAGYLEVSSSMAAGGLAPGQITGPYPLALRFIHTRRRGTDQYLIAKLKVRIYCQQELASDRRGSGSLATLPSS